MIASRNATAKESEISGQKEEKPSKFEQSWSNSSFDMDNSAFQSQGSISTISTSTVDPQGGANNSGAHSEFVNHGEVSSSSSVVISTNSRNATELIWHAKEHFPSMLFRHSFQSCLTAKRSLLGALLDACLRSYHLGLLEYWIRRFLCASRGNFCRLILWNQTRQRWIGNKKSEDLVQQPGEPKLNWNVITCESLLRSDKPLPHPIPLSETVDFLVNTWKQEGLYDLSDMNIDLT